jgi:hypothetical protein
VVKEKKEKALAEHVARHPEDVGLTVEDFNWIVRVIVYGPQIEERSRGRIRTTPDHLSHRHRCQWQGREGCAQAVQGSELTAR